ncbi:MAG TPA: hypothetical protein PKH33_06670 [bacterium]|nr:hypothetical protein [bacterium]
MNVKGSTTARAARFLATNADALFLLAACFLALTLLREQTNVLHKQWKTAMWSDETLLERPSKYSHISVLNMLPQPIKKATANVFWIRAMSLKADQAFEMRKEQASGAKLSGLMAQAGLSRTTADSIEMYELIRMVTILDPTFEYAYYYGSTLLAWDEELELAFLLSEAGLRNNPKSAMIASNLSFMSYYFRGDWEMGGMYAEISHRNSGKYSSSVDEVADLYAAGRNYEMAIGFLADSIEKAKDDATRVQLQNQAGMIMVEMHIDEIDKAAVFFESIKGRRPRDVEELVAARLLSEVPQEPFGGVYVITEEGATNKPEVRNKHYKRMREYQAETPKGGRKRI